MLSVTPFNPRRGNSKKVSATTTSAAVTVGAGETCVYALNIGSVVSYFVCYKASDGAVTATSADTAIGPNMAINIVKDQSFDTIAYRTDSSTATMYFQVGTGGV